MNEVKIPMKWPTKSHRRHYEKMVKRIEKFLIGAYKKAGIIK